MGKRAIKDLQIKVRDKKGIEGWLLMTEFSKMFMESVGEAINLTFKQIGKEIDNQAGENKKDRETNKHKHQRSLLKLYNGNYPNNVASVLTSEEFNMIMHGDGHDNWDDDYYCMIEQLIYNLREP